MKLLRSKTGAWAPKHPGSIVSFLTFHGRITIQYQSVLFSSCDRLFIATVLNKNSLTKTMIAVNIYVSIIHTCFTTFPLFLSFSKITPYFLITQSYTRSKCRTQVTVSLSRGWFFFDRNSSSPGLIPKDLIFCLF